MEKSRLEAYARLIVEKGLNLDPGQEVVVKAGLDQPEFVELVVAECYRCGASKVQVEWECMAVSRLHQLHQSEETLGRLEDWELAKLAWRAERLPAFLWLDSDDPDGMSGIDQGKRARAQMARFPKIKPYRDAMDNRYQWCIAAVPGRRWAEKVFPRQRGEAAVEALWEAILACSRANGDPLANWERHNAEIHRRCEHLNALGLARLEYEAGNGTQFSVGLMPNGLFAGGDERDLSGRVFNPNIPSEEIFTTPRRGEAEGLVVSTKPLSWQGSLIDGFSLRFENGRVVEVHAREGQDALERMVAMDDGAAYLGECALIAHDSPISNTGLLFYNTLFDENASCHLALGLGFDNCVRNYEQYSKDELHAFGVNDSMIHVDFMVGTDDMDITGRTADGRAVPIFRRGAWCF